MKSRVILILLAVILAGWCLGGKILAADQPKPAAQAATDPLACAQLIADQLKDDYRKVKLLTDIAEEYLKSNQKELALSILDQAYKLTSKMHEDIRISALLAGLAEEYAGAGKFDKAMAIAASIPDKYSKGRALADIGGAYALAGQKPDAKAQAILKEIVQGLK